MLDGESGVLVIAAQRGFKKDFLEFFRDVSAEDDSACGRALRLSERLVIEDVETDAAFEPRGTNHFAGRSHGRQRIDCFVPRASPP
jgi:hypothetical protein